jgi:hypothetical protein
MTWQIDSTAFVTLGTKWRFADGFQLMYKGKSAANNVMGPFPYK